VKCDGDRVCDEATGACVRTDAGVVDDGGTTDAGPIACSPACTSPQVCDTTSGRCVECVSNSDCSCPTTQCNAQGLCEAPTGDAGVPAGGEACTSALSVNTCGQTLSFSVDLSTARDDVVGSCGLASGGGKDLLWALELDSTYDVRVTAKKATGSQAEPVVSLRRNCDQGQELACSDSLSGTASFRVKSLAPGFYTLVVDSFEAASSGRVDVTVEFLTPTQPANETCSTAATLPADTDVTVDLSTAIDDLQVTCNTAPNSADAVFRLDVPTVSDVFLTALGTTGVNPVLALRSTPCATGTQVACMNAQAGTAESLVVRSLPAGTYFVVLERVGPAVGSVTVRASVTTPTPPPANDSCTAPRAITFPTGTTSVSFSVDTSLAKDDHVGSCNTQLDSAEVVYSLTVGTQRSVVVSAQASAGSSALPVLYLRGGGCTDAQGTELACVNAAPSPSVLNAPLSAGTYFLFVEGLGPAGGGPTDVTVTLTP
jgi:hypothetical protein